MMSYKDLSNLTSSVLNEGGNGDNGQDDVTDIELRSNATGEGKYTFSTVPEKNLFTRLHTHTTE